MTAFTDELIAICRHFASVERLQVCCGDVTVPQCSVLQELREGASDVSSLAARAGSSVSAMTRLVDGLEKRGWTERTRDDEDRRRVMVRLTRKGKRLANDLRGTTDAVVQQLLARIPKGQHAQLLTSLRVVRTAMDEMRDDLST